MVPDKVLATPPLDPESNKIVPVTLDPVRAARISVAPNEPCSRRTYRVGTRDVDARLGEGGGAAALVGPGPRRASSVVPAAGPTPRIVDNPGKSPRSIDHCLLAGITIALPRMDVSCSFPLVRNGTTTAEAFTRGSFGGSRGGARPAATIRAMTAPRATRPLKAALSPVRTRSTTPRSRPAASADTRTTNVTDPGSGVIARFGRPARRLPAAALRPRFLYGGGRSRIVQPPGREPRARRRDARRRRGVLWWRDLPGLNPCPGFC